MSKKKPNKSANKAGKPNYKKQQRQQAAAGSTPKSSAPTAVPVAAAAPATAAAPLRKVTAAPSTPSPVVTLEPLAPIIVRSGRPFDFQAGADAARFPPPSTLAGCLRTAWARAAGAAFGPELAQQAIAGPLLVRVDADGQQRLLVPKPADAHYFGHADAARCLGAAPKAFDAGCGADLPAGLQPVLLCEPVDGKASSGPDWWAWDDLIAFRRSGQPPRYAQLEHNGWSPPTGDRRTHVAIDPDTLAADAGRLFQTEGLDLEPDNPWLQEQEAGSLRLLARFSAPLASGLVHVGGERRLTRLHPEPEAAWPKPPQPDWFNQMQQQGGLTLTLLTPGVFAAGFRPDWLDEDLQGEPPGAPGVRLQLVAAALARWQPHSGWDLATQQPRATRKLVAAGATYWFRLLEAPNAEALASLWLASLSDAEQDRRDGYGLALPAPWTPTV